MSEFKGTNKVFKEVLIELGFDGYKPSEMSNSDYWMCTEKAMLNYSQQQLSELKEQRDEMLQMLEKIIKQADEVIRLDSIGASETYYQLINESEQLIKKVKDNGI
jgi:hypothetical protein